MAAMYTIDPLLADLKPKLPSNMYKTDPLVQFQLHKKASSAKVHFCLLTNHDSSFEHAACN